MKYKGILLDIDNTLYSYDYAHNLALEYVFRNIAGKLTLDKETLGEYYQKAKEKVHRALAKTASSHNKLLYFQAMCEFLSLNSLRYALGMYNLYWDTFVSNMHVYDNVYDFLRLIKDRKVCLLSDLTAHTQYIKINSLGIFDYAHYLVTSEELGVDKPSPRMFTLGLEKLNLKPEEVCMIGDNYETDIIGATALGVKSFWFNPEAKTEQKDDSMVTVFTNFKELMGYFDD